ncbi:hypothetical protein [Planctomyces sp. SH-PL14]|uniref:hypothetical protein n=1 Tax=Planctomyces sp. SH-PL14 TaxID=1632864 RepID=UPI00078C45D5|nr:hypothetical protein [Planctomyces sp. SH-PL14]AMV19201.1 hypothetical protein VT03_15025 [Planctomyces sp. SH-PL14]
MIEFGLEKLAERPSLAKTWYYVLPSRLLSLLEAEGVTQRLDASLWAEEIELGKLAERLGAVGFRNGSPVFDSVLVPPPKLQDQGLARRTMEEWGLNDAERATLLNKAESRLDFERETARGYCGWLFTNPAFRSEYQALQTAMPQLLRPEGEILLPAGPTNSETELRVIRRETMDLGLLEDFCLRWRLNHVVGPRTVMPLGRQEVSPLPSLDAARAQEVGRIAFTPDIARLPPRDELREREEAAIRFTARSAEHLREWINLVESITLGKKSIARWARIYSLQHYWGVLHERHGASLNRLGSKTLDAFAQWLEIDRSTLEGDLSQIRSRLGGAFESPRGRSLD